MLDLEEGIAAIFQEAQDLDKTPVQLQFAHGLSLDTRLARDLSHEAQFIIAARSAPGIERWRCTHCGEEIEKRPGTDHVFHMGRERWDCPGRSWKSG